MADPGDPVKVVNLTPHPVVLISGDQTIELTPSGPPARLVLLPDRDDGHVQVEGLMIPLRRTAASHDVTALPEPEHGVLLVVARPVAEARPDRDDLAYPHDTVRDPQGNVIGCRALGRVDRTRAVAGSSQGSSGRAPGPAGGREA